MEGTRAALDVERGDRVLVHVGSRVEFAEYLPAVLPATVVFDQPTVAELARYLGKEPRG
ncbi:acyl carrier protein [Amycolatopsis sp. NPDC051061]|uniref:acyl carrier protein n=1 Tax=Amycolatopsis sp. NPDC051061 TaxID=3155042 RepID=UPI00342D9C09